MVCPVCFPLQPWCRKKTLQTLWSSFDLLGYFVVQCFAVENLVGIAQVIWMWFSPVPYGVNKWE